MKSSAYTSVAAVVVAILTLVVAGALLWPRHSVQQAYDSPISADPDDRPGTTCEIGKGYVRNATHESGCVCPNGYVFDTTVIGFESCMGEGSECPILQVQCVLESP